MRCVSCRREVSGDYVRFKCPSCGNCEVVRCLKCRQTNVHYKCGECSFEGP
ncbi:RNA-binding protein [Candidatus Micrarchaeota archaeon]|nr:RNA-binding protein [Candidatus Micrarchaeota archaeon]